MFVYNQDDSDIIMSCSFEGINLAELDPHEVFQVDSKWAVTDVLLCGGTPDGFFA